MIQSEIRFEHPSVVDAKSLFRLAACNDNLDLYPEYFYLVWARDFRKTSLVAKSGDRLLGYILAYIRPDDNRTLFLWQIAVDPSVRSSGLGFSLVKKLIDSVGEDVSAFEATIDVCNDAAYNTLTSLAKQYETNVSQKDLFLESDFISSHHKETLIRLERKKELVNEGVEQE
ncbi:GNAT family N-acetyltransferase [Halomonas binhaiensis]|uniref:GNAT family N-acetyltransferase n=1 Tax=Halomonas binhaiensis TaxID=2562282 RepID=A0A5C1NHX4_9GAMM|nr:GNAT family N-acetyltransferase [Halomonas binhaiensis]QEM82273.1 GNAT family N-acetyltransferase [Halomonas binhaiensis]